MPSFYTPDLDVKDDLITIEGEEYHHIVKVFRHKEKDSIKLNNGLGLIAEAVIESLGKRSLTAKITGRDVYDRKLPDISVYFSLLKNKNDHLLVEKLTELGIRHLVPIVFERTVRTGRPDTNDKLDKIAVSAIKQCDNAWKPLILPAMHFGDLLKTLQGESGRIILAATERASKLSVEKSLPNSLPPNIGIIIGPEGGFTDQEIIAMQESECKLVTLGKHILRAETAAICAVSQLLMVINDKVEEYY